jgi:outer membrane protein assembly factor BamB
MHTRVMRLLVACTAVVTVILAGSPPSAANAQTTGDWPAYLNNAGRSGFNSTETTITTSTAPTLTKLWMKNTGATVTTEPVTSGGMVYYGTWDGFEHAAKAATGAPVWSANLGTTSSSRCQPPEAGVGSTAAIHSATINGKTTTADFVGGGDGNFYALNAATGKVIWKTRLGTPPDYFLWSSPMFYDGSIYEGVSSFGACPLIRGEVVKMNAATGHIQNTLFTVPAGCIGAGVWGSPAVDTTTGDIYFATGNAIPCHNSGPVMAQSVISTSRSLKLLGSWQVPASERIADGDFGSTPTLFTATIGGVHHEMVGVPNKNGIYYAFDRSSITSGPLWERRLSYGGGCPDCGRSAIGPSAYNGHNLFVGGEVGLVAGTKCAGNIRDMRPSNGTNVWVDCLTAPVLDAVTGVPGVAFVGAGNTFYAVNMNTGAILWRFQDTSSNSAFLGPASISNGVVYVGNADGKLYAFHT